MPKLELIYKEQCNFLNIEGTIAKLVAISYFQDGKGKYADPARKFIYDGITAFEKSLTDKERRRYREILDNVQIMKGNLSE